jgi:uncharacterized protein (DUF2267 family)
MSANTEISNYLQRFTFREDRLLAQVRESGAELPTRLREWNIWVQDPEIYLNELRNFVFEVSNPIRETRRTDRGTVDQAY